MVYGPRPHTSSFLICGQCSVWSGPVSFHRAPGRGTAGMWCASVCNDYVIMSLVIRRLSSEESSYLSPLSFLCFTFFSYSVICFSSTVIAPHYSPSSSSSTHLFRLSLLLRSPFPVSPSSAVLLPPPLTSIEFSTWIATCCPTFCLVELLWGNHASRLLRGRCVKDRRSIVYCVFSLFRSVHPYPFLFLFFSLPMSSPPFLFHFILSSAPPSSPLSSHILLPGSSSLLRLPSLPRSHFLRSEESQWAADPSRVALRRLEFRERDEA